MNIGIILAGGVGSRLQSSLIPKQFVEIDKKPIIWHTVEKFLITPEIDYVIISCHPQWISFVENLIQEKNLNNKVFVFEGGSNRNESIENGIKFIQNKFVTEINDDSIIVTHDAVRMFVDSKIIQDNIKACKEKQYDVVDTVVPATDTIVISENKNSIDDIPERSFYFQGQTPQTTSWKIIKEIYKNQKESSFYKICDLCKLAKLNNNSIGLVNGSYFNFKITNDFDLKMAKILVEKNDKF